MASNEDDLLKQATQKMISRYEKATRIICIYIYIYIYIHTPVCTSKSYPLAGLLLF